MRKEGHLFDDLARVAGGAASSLSALREEIEARLREQFERMLANMELVRRDEFEAVRAMAEKAREENEALAARVAALEGRLPAAAAAAKPARRRPAAKRKAAGAAAAKRPRKAGGGAAKKG